MSIWRIAISIIFLFAVPTAFLLAGEETFPDPADIDEIHALIQSGSAEDRYQKACDLYRRPETIDTIFWTSKVNEMGYAAKLFSLSAEQGYAPAQYEQEKFYDYYFADSSPAGAVKKARVKDFWAQRALEDTHFAYAYLRVRSAMAAILEDEKLNYTMLADQGHSGSLYILARGEVGLPDRWLDAMEKAADRNNVFAMQDLAQYHQFGFYDTAVCEPDPEQAAQYLHKAMALGSLEAAYRLARYNEKPANGEKTTVDAKDIYQRCASQDHELSRIRLDDLQRGGDIDSFYMSMEDETLLPMVQIGIPEALYAQAVREGYLERRNLAQRAVAYGHPGAMNLLGQYYRENDGQRITVHVVKLIQYAADQGVIDAKNNLGELYLEDHYFLPRSEIQARKLFTEAAKNDHPKGWNNLGICFENGWGGAVNKKKAVEAYRNSMRLEVPEAVDNLARCHAHGIGVERNMARADDLYRQADAMGHRPALYNLAIDYKYAPEPDRDEGMAESLLLEVASDDSTQSHPNWYQACSELGDLYLERYLRNPSDKGSLKNARLWTDKVTNGQAYYNRGRILEIDGEYEEARKYYGRAGQFPPAYLAQGLLHMNPKYQSPNYSVAVENLRKALDAGVVAAEEPLRKAEELYQTQRK